MGKGTDHGGLFKARLTQAINDGETCFTHNSQEYNTKEASYVLRMESGMRVWDAVYGSSAAEPEPEPTAETQIAGTTWYYKVPDFDPDHMESAILTLFDDGTYKMATVAPLIKVAYHFRWFMGNWTVAEDGHLIAEHEHYNQVLGEGPGGLGYGQNTIANASQLALYEEGDDGEGQSGYYSSDSVFPPWSYRSDDPIPAGYPLSEFTWKLWNTQTNSWGGEYQPGGGNPLGGLDGLYQWNDSMFFQFMSWTKMDFVENPAPSDIPGMLFS